ncbi:flagellin N-terminal helical domain-containing protein [Novosphingobium pokkalii]|uniref:Flagellin n=1 Tax=Novosphingobium pokkalii TaxID=1770194 RepID=A0ABV7V3I1_9SPHN|nr:flagellin [Novosphingobium pokkalii]GHC91496.1 flagellin [Novosphingobium pokkalii]
MAVINTNVSAIKAANASNSAGKLASTAMERLSTGKRINSAKDDAAGLAIATTMTAQITGMSQAVRNSNDGISLAQTAEGALSEVTNMLQRVRELAVQSKSDTYQTSDREAMQSEVSNLTNQISDVLNNTKFNGNAVFKVDATATDSTTDTDGDGVTDLVQNANTVKIQTGANTSDTVDLVVKAFAGKTFFGDDGGTNNTAYSTTTTTTQAFDVSDTAKASTTITNVDDAIKQVNATRATLGAGQNRLESVVNNLNDNITNLSDARSRIQDTDYSAETTQMAKAQILAQASTAMISQANQNQQNVLTLLR